MKKSHGMSRTPIYGIWRSMLTRCYNPNFKFFNYYGGRGIGVCKRWQKFENFYADMGDRPEGKSLDRINNSKGYSPKNCKWSDAKEQSRNRSGLHTLTANGKTACMGEWAEVTGLSVGTLWNRVKLGWTDEDAVNTPKVRKRSTHKKIRLGSAAKTETGSEYDVQWSEKALAIYDEMMEARAA